MSASAAAQTAANAGATSTGATSVTPEQHDLVTGLQAMLPDLSLGAILGFATGIAVKAIGRVVLLIVGLLFIAIQLLSMWHIVSVDWLRLQSLTDPWLHQSGEAGLTWFTRVLTSRLPFTGAFIAGLLLGLRR